MKSSNKQKITNKKPKRIIYRLTCDDLSGLGGPMGTERTYQLFSKAFSTKELAHAFAVKDAAKYGGADPVPPLKEWVKHSTGKLGIDCRCVGYGIERETID